MAHALFQDFLKVFFPLPPLASLEGQRIDLVMYLVHILMFALFAGWGIFFIFVLWRFRQKKNPKGSYHGLSNRLSVGIEIAIALIEAILLIGISIPFWNAYMTQVPQGKNVLHIKLIAQQFAWNIHYPGPDGKFGRSDEKFYDEQDNPLGLDPHDPKGQDDFVVINDMHLPVGVTVVIDLTSRDVIHSFTLPEMRIKRDIIPGQMLQTWFTPSRTGTYDIACSQLCGVGHYRMKGVLTVESPQAFQQWVKSNTMKYFANP
jgi:cytochrome c oxidase subunit 2